jgi:tetratricopeptide (TPR) repeat protein
MRPWLLGIAAHQPIRRTSGGPTNDFRYKAFISYSWADKTWAGWLHRVLEAYRPPKGMNVAARPLYPIFKDREEEAAGASIGASIEAALGASEFLIVLCSPRAVASPWVNHEVAWFKIHRDPKKILALIVGGEPGSSQTPAEAADACFPASLLYQVNADLLATEVLADAPLAADARAHGDGKRLAKLKLAAAMLGVGLDTLVQRDDRRRAARRRLLLVGLMALSTVLAGLSIFAFNQRDAALHARNQAVASKQEAEFQRDQAQGLVEFMVTDLRKRLDAVGRLDVLEAVGSQLADFYAKQNLATLNPDALGRRARVQLLLGEVDNLRGNLDPALARYREAAATTQELLRRDPDNQQRIFDHAQAVFWVGQIAWQRGDATTARSFWTQYYAQAQRLVALDPDKDDWQAELMYADSNLGTLDMDQGDAKAAAAHFAQSLSRSIKIYGEAPQTAQAAIELGQSYSWLANALFHQAKLDEAQAARRAELAVYARANQGNPGRADIKKRESIARYDLADMLLAAGQIEEATTEAKVAVELADGIRSKDPENLGLADRASLAHTLLGEAYGHAGQTGAARQQLAAAIAIADRLVAKDESIVRWRGKVGALPRLILARLEARSDQPTTASATYLRLTSSLRPLLAAGTSKQSIESIYCAALAGQARLAPQNHGANWQEIIAMLGPKPERHSPKTLTVLAEALVNSERADTAKSIVAKLYQAGYRHPEFMALLNIYPVLSPP